ncbi:MAG: Rne/Rng family ribonuclease [Proteobacteria bacterium]|nr:Rne/Rng family ribonuclease [Pseudomonadota bacterium]
MQSKMLINAIHPEESRVAILEGGVLQELEVEFSGKGDAKGNVYKGKVAMIQPSIHALFIDYGGNKHGFLPFPEIHPSLYGRKSEEEGGTEGERPTIEKNMKAGQEIMVQIVKEERDNKGAYLTTYISIAGRYLVLMPGSKKGGVSRKIESEAERAKLREDVSFLDVPEDMGLIIRTAGMGRTRGELKRDLTNLLRVWKGIKDKEAKQKAPSIIYQEGDIVIRSIRDYFSSEMNEIIVDNLEVYKKAKDFMKLMMPRFQNRVRLHQENIPLFSKFNLEEQIESIYGNTVLLKSGASIVIDPTEALVSIDVNSGRSKGEKNIEDTAFQTNLEAAAEVARQLRLRDLGGLIVIDFIDMRQKKHVIDVEKALKSSLKRDKARIDVGRVSKFGLLEMSRQRIKSSLMERSFVACPNCAGRGTIKSVESNALYLLRKIHAAAIDNNITNVDLLLPVEIAEYLQNRKRGELLDIETDHGVKIVIKGQQGIPVNSYNMEVTKKEAVPDTGKPKIDKTPDKETLSSDEKGKVEPERKPRPRKKPYGSARRRGKPQEKKAGDVVEKKAGGVVEKKAVPNEVETEGSSEKGLLGRIRSALKGD